MASRIKQQFAFYRRRWIVVELMLVGCQMQNNGIYAYDRSLHCTKIQIAIADYRCSFRLSSVLAGQSRTSHPKQHKLCTPQHEHEHELTLLPNIIEHVYCIQIELVVVVVVSTKAGRERERETAHDGWHLNCFTSL